MRLLLVAAILCIATSAGAQANRVCFDLPADAAKRQRIVDAFVAAHDYRATIHDPASPPPGTDGSQTMANPESKADFFRRMIRAYIVKVVASREGTEAGDTTSQQTQTDLDGAIQ